MQVALYCSRGVPPELRSRLEAQVRRLAAQALVVDEAEVRLRAVRSGPATERQHCEVTLRGHGRVLHAAARARDLEAAVELALARVAHQAERVRTKVLRRTRTGASLAKR
jgi:ribosome-associated translation inhibitor RaiA